MILRHTFITASITGFAATCSASNYQQADVKPNIVIILADDMGWGDLNLNGNNTVSTPAINALANQSMSFDRFYVCPVSAPTRSEMLTGRYFLRTGVSSVTRGFENMRTEEVTIAEILKENGYATGCFGKWHNGGYYQQHPNRQGFDEYVGFMVGHLGYYFDAFYMNNDTEVKSDGYASDYFTDKALGFIEKNKDNPFLCYVPYNVPHSPFQVPEKYFNKYNSQGIDSTLSSVYGMVENMDDNINRILEKLDELKLRENTIVIFFSDNGPNTRRYNGDMKGIKGSVDEGGVRTPFYISWPGKIESGITSQLAQDIDIMPTLLGLSKIQYDPVNPIDGIDLSGIISGKKKQFDRYIFSRQGNASLQLCSGSLRNDKYRLVRSVRDTLLFDMITDPFQKKNIFRQQKEEAYILLSALTKWENELVTAYKPVTTINAGFPEEKSFKLPVQDATLSGKIKYSSIHPNQSHTENWIQNGDSISWTLNINTPGVYKAELQYGAPEGETGSAFILRSASSATSFTIDIPFDSKILPDRDYVKRSESVERTWTWMTAGNLELRAGNERITLILKEKKKYDAGLIKSVRLSAVNPVLIPPYPEIRIISGIDIDWTTHQRHAQGSDNFQLTWADDDNQYGIWGDGDGFAGTNGKYRVSLGVARIEGDEVNYKGYDRYGHKESSENEAVIKGKSWGIICVKGVLYTWVHPDKPGGWGSWEYHHTESRLFMSEDKGASWHPASWAFTKEEGLVGGNILQFGKNYSGARDKYVYHYMSDPEILYDSTGTATELMVPGKIYLLRTPLKKIMERDTYEFFSGLIGGTPSWTRNVEEKQPVFIDNNGVGTPIGISFNPALKRYLLSTEHSKPHSGMLGVFESPEPWGPWSTVTYVTNESWFGHDIADIVPRNCFFWCFPVKWISVDGRSATMAFTGGGRGKNNDSFNTVRVKFKNP